MARSKRRLHKTTTSATAELLLKNANFERPLQVTGGQQVYFQRNDARIHCKVLEGWRGKVELGHYSHSAALPNLALIAAILCPPFKTIFNVRHLMIRDDIGVPDLYFIAQFLTFWSFWKHPWPTNKWIKGAMLTVWNDSLFCLNSNLNILCVKKSLRTYHY